MSKSQNSARVIPRNFVCLRLERRRDMSQQITVKHGGITISVAALFITLLSRFLTSTNSA